MLFTTRATRWPEYSRVGPGRLLPGASGRKKKERKKTKKKPGRGGWEGEAAWSNEQAAFSKEAAARGRQVGEKVLPRWTSVILTPLLQRCHALWCTAPSPPIPPLPLCCWAERCTVSERLPPKVLPHRTLFHAGAPQRLVHSALSLFESVEQLSHATDPARLVCLSFLSPLAFTYLSVSLWFRTELPIHHPVHRRHFPPDHPGDSVRLLEALQVRATLSSHSPPTPSPTPLSLSFLPLFLAGFDIGPRECVTRILSGHWLNS